MCSEKSNANHTEHVHPQYPCQSVFFPSQCGKVEMRNVWFAYVSIARSCLHFNWGWWLVCCHWPHYSQTTQINKNKQDLTHISHRVNVNFTMKTSTLQVKLVMRLTQKCLLFTIIVRSFKYFTHQQFWRTWLFQFFRLIFLYSYSTSFQREILLFFCQVHVFVLVSLQVKILHTKHEFKCIISGEKITHIL